MDDFRFALEGGHTSGFTVPTTPTYIARPWSHENSILSKYASYLKAYYSLKSLVDLRGSHGLTNNNTVSFANDGKFGKCATLAGNNYLSAAAHADFQFASADWLFIKADDYEFNCC